MGFRALFRGATSSAIPKEVKFDMASQSLPSLSEGQEHRSSRGKIKALRGSWGDSSTAGKLESTTSASSYPIAAIDGLTKDTIIDLTDIGQGIGAALWVTDQNNWWGVSSYQQTESCNCSTSYYSCNCKTTYYSCNCKTTYYACSWYTKYVCADRAPNGYCRSYYSYQAIASYCSRYSCSTCSRYTCSTCSATSCDTCYPQYIRIIQSVANSVSTILSWSYDTVAKALRIKTANKEISVESYSDTSFANLIGSQTYSASSAVETTNFGIMATPSSYNESRTLGSIKIRRNR